MNYIRHLIRNGELGEIRHARFQRLQDWGERAIGWRQYKAMAGSGELGDMGIHRIDFAQDLLGPITSVTASAKQLVPRDVAKDGSPVPPQDVEDWVAWIAEFKDGTTGVFEMGKLTKGQGPGGDHDLAEFNGTKASAAYRLHAPHEILLGGRQEPYKVVPVPEEFLTRPGSPRNPGEGDPNQIFRFDQAWEFISAIREGRDAHPSFYEGVRAQAVADSILQAVEERRWVDVPDVP
jgi:predicted dehydrogenase